MNDNELNEFNYYHSEYDVEPNFDKDAAIYQIGLRMVYNKAKMSTGLNPAIKQKYTHILNNQEEFKDEIINIGKEQYLKCVSNEQLIPEKYWVDVRAFTPPKVTALHHPHFRLLFDLSKDIYKMNSDTLVVCSCGGSKPYIDNSKYSMLLKASRAGYFDLMVMSIYPVFLYPMDTSRMYPNSFYEWPHTESPRLFDDYANNNLHHMVEFLNLFHYKKVILIHTGKYEYFYRKTVEICESWPWIEYIHILPDDEMLKKLKDKFASLWPTRVFISKALRERMLQILGKEDDTVLKNLWNFHEDHPLNTIEDLFE